MTGLTIDIEGIRSEAEFMGHLAKDIEKATIRALNYTATKTRTALDKEVRSQVAFPAIYLRPSSGNLTVAEHAGPGRLQVTIRGRDYPTSLARFSSQKAPGRVRGGVSVMVKPGRRKRIKGAFIINLKNGNRGLAVRTDGSPPPRAWRPKAIGREGNLWLLYGPSVDQVLMGIKARNGGAFGDVEPEVVVHFEKEFWRLLDAGVK